MNLFGARVSNLDQSVDKLKWNIINSIGYAFQTTIFPEKWTPQVEHCVVFINLSGTAVFCIVLTLLSSKVWRLLNLHGFEPYVFMCSTLNLFSIKNIFLKNIFRSFFVQEFATKGES